MVFITSSNIPSFKRRVSQKTFYPTYPAATYAKAIMPFFNQDDGRLSKNIREVSVVKGIVQQPRQANDFQDLNTNLDSIFYHECSFTHNDQAHLPL